AGVADYRRLLACGELPVRRTDLLVRQSALEEAAQQGAREASASGPLGNDTGSEFLVRPLESPYPETRSQYDSHHRGGARRTGVGCKCLHGGDLQRGLSKHLSG